MQMRHAFERMTLGRALMMGVSAAALLAGLGLAVFPTTLANSQGALGGLIGVCVILTLYGVAAVWLPPRLGLRQPWLLRAAITFGLLAGAVYAGEIVLEYLLLPADNTPYGLVEFGAIFLLYFAAGLYSAWRSGRARDGPIDHSKIDLTLPIYTNTLAQMSPSKPRPRVIPSEARDLLFHWRRNALGPLKSA